ncbi:MAG: hypothetical protein FWD68_16990 [Alphaproteobacteria bacterium]|nr:hypothetical protein [Alphaproteobacteria bacterium]
MGMMDDVVSLVSFVGLGFGLGLLIFFSFRGWSPDPKTRELEVTSPQQGRDSLGRVRKAEMATAFRVFRGIRGAGFS